MTEMRQDIGYALRLLWRAPGFTAVAILTLALGVGVNSAIFSVVNGVLLQPLPYRAADRLYVVRMLYPDGTAYGHLSAPDFMSIREGARVLEQVDAYAAGLSTLSDAGEPREVRVARVSDGLFALLGTPVLAGRAFVVDEHQPGRAQAAVLDHAFWTQAFGADPAAVGRMVTVGASRVAIVGVLAPGARLPQPADVYLPIEYGETFSAATATGRRGEYLAVLARARAGVTGGQIADDLSRIGADLQRAFPETNGRLTFTPQPLRDAILGDVETPLLVLLGAVAFVLLVACANVANLLLARASVRRGELAVRAALGASRARLVRQLLTESSVLGVAGATLGLAIAYAGASALVAAQPADLPRLDEVGVDGTVLLFTFLTAVLTSVAFGTLPALHATSRRLSPALVDESRTSTGAGGHRIRAALVVGETALAVVLLVGAGLLIRSFIELTHVDPGFRPEHALSFRVPVRGAGYEEDARIRQRVAEIEERLRALPGASAAAATSLMPLSGRGGLIDFRVEGAPPPPANVNAEIGIASVRPDYFQAIGTPLRRGRVFSDRDTSEAPPVAIINEAAARFWFPGEDPLRRRVEMSGTSYEIVGIVADFLQGDPGQPPFPQIFVPYDQMTMRTVRFVVRTAGDPLILARAIRSEIQALDPNLPVGDVSPLEQLVTTSLARPRFYTALLALFAAVALALAATGIFGVMSYAVAQRRREIGIRMALGARGADVLRMIVGRAMGLAAGGLAIGLILALALGRFIQSQLFGVALLDPLTLVAAALVLLAFAAGASCLPAWRAATANPVSVLRDV